MPSKSRSIEILFLVSISLASAQLPKFGLLCDLDANKDVYKDAKNLVYKWENQAVPVGHPGREFVERIYSTRPSPLGRPTYKPNQINGFPSLAFWGNPSLEIISGDDLINMDGPDVYDHLIQGSGYTWIAVIKPYKQISVNNVDNSTKDINILFGNLKNGDTGTCQYCGFWGGISGSDDRPMFFWAGNRGDDDFTAGAPYENQPYSTNSTGHYRSDGNPHVHAKQMTVDKWEIVGARMASGTGDVWIETFMGNSNVIIAKKPWRVYENYNSSEDADMLVIGTERDAKEHVGLESFDGEFARFLIWERPLNDAELQQALNAIDSIYFRAPVGLGQPRKADEISKRLQATDCGRSWYKKRSLNGRSLGTGKAK